MSERDVSGQVRTRGVRRPVLVTVLLLALGTATRAWAVEATVADLLRDPVRFSGQIVTVRGTLGVPQTLPSRRAAVTAFDLTDAGALLKVIAVIRPPCSPGSVVTVDGRFDPLRNVEGMTFINVLDASVVRCR